MRGTAMLQHRTQPVLEGSGERVHRMRKESAANLTVRGTYELQDHSADSIGPSYPFLRDRIRGV